MKYSEGQQGFSEEALRSATFGRDVLACETLRMELCVERLGEGGVRVVGRGVPTAPKPLHNGISFSIGCGAMGTSRPTGGMVSGERGAMGTSRPTGNVARAARWGHRAILDLK